MLAQTFRRTLHQEEQMKYSSSLFTKFMQSRMQARKGLVLLSPADLSQQLISQHPHCQDHFQLRHLSGAGQHWDLSYYVAVDFDVKCLQNLCFLSIISIMWFPSDSTYVH